MTSIKPSHLRVIDSGCRIQEKEYTSMGFKEALRLIHTTYADAKIDLTEVGIILSPSRSSVKKRTMGKSL